MIVKKKEITFLDFLFFRLDWVIEVVFLRLAAFDCFRLVLRAAGVSLGDSLWDCFD